MFLTHAHKVWKEHLSPGDRAIDATAGNGYDTEFLAEIDLSHLYVFDIQEKALKNTEERVGKRKNISYHLRCHSTFLGVEKLVSLIVYNLGYLPGGDKSITTRVETTLKSLQKGIELLDNQGLISVTLYPGHEEGAREEEMLLKWSSSLYPKDFQISHHRVINRSKAPSLLLIQKMFTT